MTKRQRVVWAVVLAVLLGMWIALEMSWMTREDARYQARMLRVVDVDWDHPSTSSALDEVLRARVDPHMQMIAACLATTHASRAPATWQVRVTAAGQLASSLWQAEGGIEAEQRACLARVNEALEWPTSHEGFHATVHFASLAKASSDSANE